jgi:uncharacterized membrane protein
MMNLRQLLTTPFQRSISRGLIIFLIIIALIGFADATYLTIEHYAGNIPPCTTDGCETVLTSSYSTIAGIPVALSGAVFYLAFLVLIIAYLLEKKEIILKIALLLTTLGFLASIYFFILQAFVIQAFCQYCLLSAATSTILFVASVFIFKKYRNESL